MSRKNRTASSKEVSKIKEADALEAIVEESIGEGEEIATLALDKPWWVDAERWQWLSEEQKQELVNRT